ncbi:MAG: type 1 glutamine amidotransferase [Deltaproteobacteria bacterium]|nr:type 1 glutamine amidotransferase [Deltaproteobacteria bacterium]
MNAPRVKVLVIDNTIDRPFKLAADFRRFLAPAEIHVRRGPQRDFPGDVSAYTHLLLTGSKTSCSDRSKWVEREMELARTMAEEGKPVLGVCFGHQILARAFGGAACVRAAAKPELGWCEVCRVGGPSVESLLSGLPSRFYTFQSHMDEVARLPGKFVATATSERCAIQAFRHERLPIFGIQFHPEKKLEEGQASIEARRGTIPEDCIFNTSRAKSVYSDHVADVIFRNFLEQESAR